MSCRPDSIVTVAGLVLVRHGPAHRKGVVFMTLEDETDIANIIVWPKVFEKNRRHRDDGAFPSPCAGACNAPDSFIHVIAKSFVDLSAELPRLRDGDLFSPKFSGGSIAEPAALPLKSRDFH